MLALFLPFFLSPVLAQTATITATETTTATVTVAPTLTRVVSLFYLAERAYDGGLPYTLFHEVYGSVVAVDSVNNLTTYVVTTTRVGRRDGARGTKTLSVSESEETTAAVEARAGNDGSWWRKEKNFTGKPSTITQGPSTFMFTGTRYSPEHTVINRCSLNGTHSAACNLTHVGAAWYTTPDPVVNSPRPFHPNPSLHSSHHADQRDASPVITSLPLPSKSTWNGTYSTYSYNWTSGDRFGFAPVTITAGAELLTAPEAEATKMGAPQGSGSEGSSGAESLLLSSGSGAWRLFGLWAGWFMVWVILGVW